MSNFIDLTGQRFGKLIVLEKGPKKGDKITWKCKCDCGNITYVMGSNLRTQHTTSCGCVMKQTISEIGKKNKKNLIGQTIGDLTVLSEGRKDNTNKIIWKCQCICGNTIELTTEQINHKYRHLSCGCNHSYDKNRIKANERFGKLTTIKLLPQEPGHFLQWECQCDCGNIIKKTVPQLLSGFYTQCEKCLLKSSSSKKELKSTTYVDMSGQKIGHLTVIAEAEKPLHKNDTLKYWECLCDCGNTIIVAGSDLRVGKTKSCGCSKYRSYGEDKIVKILNKNNIKYIREYSNNTCKFTDTNYLARFDFYLPDYNTIIEYNGIQHYIKANSGYNGPERFQKTQEHDQIKIKWCLDNNFNLICIPYTKYDTLNLEDLLPQSSQFLINKPLQ